MRAVHFTHRRSDAQLPGERRLPNRLLHRFIEQGRGSRDAIGARGFEHTRSADPADLSITPDNVEGGRIALNHLFESGRARVAHITGPQTEQASVDRAEGIRQALEARGVSLIYATSYGEWTERWGRSACAMLLDQGKSVDAILCDSDQIGRGALDALRERGISVPGDIAIMGFDNWDVIVDGTHPALTSVDMNLDLLGRMAAERLFGAIGGKPLTPGTLLVPCRLAIRASTTQAI